MANTELQFEIAMRDQVIHNQREAQRNLWNMLLGLGLGQNQILDLAAKQGITIENWTISASGSLNRKPSPITIRPSESGLHRTACVRHHHHHHHQAISSTAYLSGLSDMNDAISQEEHHRSFYYLLSSIDSTPAYSQWASERMKCLCVAGKLNSGACRFCSSIRTRGFSMP